MDDDVLASSVVHALSQYVIRKNEVGATAFDAQLGGLLGHLEAKLAGPYPQEILARFLANPADPVEVETLRLHLARELRQDPGFGRQLYSDLGGRVVAPPPDPRKRKKVVAGAAGAVVLLLLGFVAARAFTSEGGEAAPPPSTTTSTVLVSPPVTTTPTTTARPSSSSVSPPTGSVPPSAIAGDGSSLAADAPVWLAQLPVPNNSWVFDNGDHDVQLTQHQESVWASLNSCYTTSREQQFRLKNFKRLEVTAVGTDSTSDPQLAVKFQVFVNSDLVKPVAEVVVNPGEAKPLKADLPQNVFAITLRSSVTTPDKNPCRAGKAVWGAPYVVATGAA
ncbi:hypothetical protein BBK82_27610 [Lentzea guizhouensis]|uniref:Glycosyl hydrolase family 98 putative carbohydrate-binding module domain-containing protein n=1 Tax=Lentzea guizhouensis TaxID=1586287 RepID=A0A1B2HNI1_9PSEU|nr:hypothetical protein [Lentzea guizhouensis]ANZ39266.1 hypothetical protein BBK82_27610 [Lentzea guizhouensis]